MKKRTKKLLPLVGSGYAPHLEGVPCHIVRKKVFWFFFSKKNCFLLPCLILSACATTPACRFSRVADLPLRFSSGHLLIDATINDHPATMVFDTGAFTTTVDERATDRFGLRMERPFAGFLSGVGGSQPFSLVKAHSLGLGRMRGGNFLFASTNIGAMRGLADGLLSSDFLSRFDLDLDFPAGRLILYQPAGRCDRATVFLDPPLYAVPIESFAPFARTPRILVRIRSQTFTAAIDSGAPGSVMTSSAAARLGLHIADLKNDRELHAGGIGPLQVRTVRHVLEPVRIGDLTINNMPVGILDQASLGNVDMLLGLDFQTRVHLWISYSSHTLVVQYPSRPSPAPIGEMR